MIRKGRSRRPKIPVAAAPSVRNGVGQAVPASGVSERGVSLLPSGEMVETGSSPPISALRPEAPALEFSLTSVPPTDSPQSAESTACARSTETAASAQSAEPAEREDFGRDDGSFPPVDLDAGFFAADSAPSEASFEVETRDQRAAMKLTPAAAQRRAHLAKYVTAAVGLASALCVAALVKISVTPSHEESRPELAAQAAGAMPPAVNAALVTETVPSPPLPANSAPAVPAVTAEVAPPTVDQATSPATGTAAEPGSVAKAEALAEPAAHPPLEGAGGPAQGTAVAPPRRVVAAPAEPAADPKAAAKEAANEKAKSRGALERGNMTGAIASGERSVAIDPTDAEAWLILGAAYQQRGDAKNAVRSFKACVSQGKRGPTSDCAAMLR